MFILKLYVIDQKKVLVRWLPFLARKWFNLESNLMTVWYVLLCVSVYTHSICIHTLYIYMYIYIQNPYLSAFSLWRKMNTSLRTLITLNLSCLENWRTEVNRLESWINLRRARNEQKIKVTGTSLNFIFYLHFLDYFLNSFLILHFLSQWHFSQGMSEISGNSQHCE